MPVADQAISGLLEDAVALRRKGALADAAERYRQVLRSDPQHVDALYYLAQLSCQGGDVVGGVDLVRRALAVDPRQGRLHNLLGMALSALGSPQDALASFNAAIRSQPELASAHGSRGDVLVTLGRLGEAVESYDRALTIEPGSVETWCNRGAALQELGRPEEALASYQRAIALNPDFAEVQLNIANVLVQLGRHQEALASYQAALSIRPDAIDAALGKGAVLVSLARHEEALGSFEAVLSLDPENIEALNGRGFVLNLLNRPAEALSACDRVLGARPDHVEALNNRGNALCALDRHEEGLASYDRALEWAPSNVDALANRGYALNVLGRPAEALESCDRALAIRPDCVAALNHRGIALMTLRRSDEALSSYEKALGIKPDDLDALNNRGNALFALNRYDDALASYEAVLSRAPDYVNALYNRGMSLYVINRGREAAETFEKVLSRQPDHARARIGACMAQLPILYSNTTEIAECRAAYEKSLRRLCEDVERNKTGGALAGAIGSMQPFYLAYQGCNNRDLQALYGSMVCHAVAQRYQPAVLPPPPGPGEPVRVGIVTGFFFQHSVWKCLLKGWMNQLDRGRFRMFGYHTGSTQDAETIAAASFCHRFVQGPLPVERWRQTILADAPHVLIYPELGMDPVCPQLAAQRLASIQCNSWGHPDTSGFPTLDYYLSSDLMEPPGGQEHYTERLVRLANLSGYYEPSDPPPASQARPDLGIRRAAATYWSPQSLYKYLPRFDPIFPRIARAVGDCQFVFIQDKSTHVTELFRKRLEQAFAEFDMKAADYCVILPRLDQAGFVAAMRQCDIFLDSLEWSGCTTSLECLPHNLPMVTMAGQLMRGRHTAAFLRMMDVTETIAETIDDYVAIAVRLARDPPWRAAVKERIRSNKDRVYRDRACISALEEFLDRVAHRGVGG